MIRPQYSQKLFKEMFLKLSNIEVELETENLEVKKSMNVKRHRNTQEYYPLLRELLWREKYIESGENVMISEKAFIYMPNKKKRKIEQLDEFGYLVEDRLEDEYIEMET